MSSNHLQLLSKLTNGVLTREERAYVSCWTARFAHTSISKQKQQMLRKNRTDKCSVCAFVSRCTVIQADMGNKVHTLDHALHSVGVHLPVNWTMICILGGILMDVYTTCVNVELDSLTLEPGDIVHHYMLSSECLYERDGPMVAIRDVCSYLMEHMPVNDDEGEEHDLTEGCDDSFEMDEFFDKEAHEKNAEGHDMHRQTKNTIEGIISMINRKDISPGKCEDMAYILPHDKALADVMRIPRSVMLGEDISDQFPEKDDDNTNPNLSEEHDHLYDIYKDMQGEAQGEIECMVMEHEPFNTIAHKVPMLLLGTYEWMTTLPNAAIS